MKAFTKTIVLTLILCAAAAARAEEKLYALVAYMHVPETSSQQDYLALEKLWLRLHQKAVDTGLCRGWTLYRVENGGRNQFATVELYDSLDKFEQRWPESIRKNLYNSEEETLMNKTGATRSLTRREVWAVEASTARSSADATPVTIYVDFMKANAGQTGKYYHMEKDQFRKFHQAHVDAGKLQSWTFLSHMFSGADAEYNFVTLNAFGEKQPAWDNKLAQSAVTKEEWENRPKTTDLRTTVRRETWRPIYHTTAAQEIAAAK